MAYIELGLTSASSIAVDPLNPNTLYATSAGALRRSTDGGVTFSALKLPSSQLDALAISPVNDQILYAGTFNQGTLKSTNGGATWTTANGSLTGSNGEFAATGIWIDPTMPNVLLANINGNFYRSADSGASWQLLYSPLTAVGVTFDSVNSGTLYVTTYSDNANFKSTDHGQTFTVLATPGPFGAILADPNHPGRLLGDGLGEIYESDNGGSTWIPKMNLGFENSSFFFADWANGFIYAVVAPSGIVRISSDLQTFTPVGPPALGNLNGVAVANGHVYVASSSSRDVYVTKLDPLGNIVYSTYFGGERGRQSRDRNDGGQIGKCLRDGDDDFAGFPRSPAKGAYAPTCVPPSCSN